MDLQKWKTLARSLIENYKNGHSSKEHNMRIHDALWKDWVSLFKGGNMAVVMYSKVYGSILYPDYNNKVSLWDFEDFLNEYEDGLDKPINLPKLLDLKVIALDYAGHDMLEYDIEGGDINA